MHQRYISMSSLNAALESTVLATVRSEAARNSFKLRGDAQHWLQSLCTSKACLIAETSFRYRNTRTESHNDRMESQREAPTVQLSRKLVAPRRLIDLSSFSKGACTYIRRLRRGLHLTTYNGSVFDFNSLPHRKSISERPLLIDAHGVEHIFSYNDGNVRDLRQFDRFLGPTDKRNMWRLESQRVWHGERKRWS